MERGRKFTPAPYDPQVDYEWARDKHARVQAKKHKKKLKHLQDLERGAQQDLLAARGLLYVIDKELGALNKKKTRGKPRKGPVFTETQAVPLGTLSQTIHQEHQYNPQATAPLVQQYKDRTSHKKKDWTNVYK
mmetsp:Transcript_4531/g.5890  ORF Transcript_4531/g.5890 Transcript_4531/m.5890 type:complete len:133 (+) Transcript_4531:63-461(+)